MKKETNDFRGLLVEPFSRATLLRVWFCVGLVGMQWFGLKLHKLWLLHQPHHGPILQHLQPILFWDGLLLLTVATFFLYWLQYSSGSWRTIGVLTLHTSMFVVLLLATIEHRFFTITYTIIDWNLLKYGARQFWMLFSMIRSQLNPATLLLLALPVAVMWLPIWFEQLPKIDAWLSRSPRTSRLRAPSFLALLALLWTGLFALHIGKEHKALSLLRHNFLLSWAGGLIKDSAPRPTLSFSKNHPKAFKAQQLHFVPTSQMRRPNVVFIILESMRLRSTTLANPDLQTTPFLATLAKQSLRVDQMYPVIPHTSKAVVSIFCGIYPKISMEVIEGEVGGIPARCLPKLLEGIGYQTAIFHPATLRFENYDQLSKNVGFSHINGLEHFSTEGFFRTNYFGYEDRIMLRPSLAWIDKAQQSKRPFFVAYHTLTSHHGYMTPPQFRKRTFTPTQDPEYQQYLNALRYTDDFVATLFGEFKKRGMLKDTIFVLVADHGEAFGEHKRRQHDNGMWEEMLRIPTLLYAPSIIKKPRLIKGIRQQIDLLPTIADLLKVKLTGGQIPGKSLLKPTHPNRKIFMSCWYERYCMASRTQNTKFIYRYQRAPVETYRLDKDPMERQDLSHQLSFFKRQASWLAELKRWRRQVNLTYEQPDPFRLKEVVSLTPPKVDVKVGVMLGPYLRMVGFRRHTKELRPGAPFELTYVFEVLKKLPIQWRLFYHLDVFTPNRFMNLDHPPVGGAYPTHLWRPGQFILDRHRFHLPADFPPHARFDLGLGLWSKKDGRATLTYPHKSPKGTQKNRLTLLKGTIQSPTLQAGRPPIQKLLEAQLSPSLHLVGYNLHSEFLKPGKNLDITLVYRVLQPIPPGWKLYFHIEQLPKGFVNADRSLPPHTPPLHKWTPSSFVQLRFKRRLPKTFYPKKSIQFYTGLWSKGRKAPKVTGPKDSVKTDKKNRLLLFDKALAP